MEVLDRTTGTCACQHVTKWMHMTQTYSQRRERRARRVAELYAAERTYVGGDTYSNDPEVQELGPGTRTSSGRVKQRARMVVTDRDTLHQLLTQHSTESEGSDDSSAIMETCAQQHLHTTSGDAHARSANADAQVRQLSQQIQRANISITTKRGRGREHA